MITRLRIGSGEQDDWSKEMTDFTRVPGPGGMSFSDAISTPQEGRWVHLSGQLAIDPEVGIAEITGDVAEQSNRIFDRIEQLLQEMDADLSHVVRVTAYLTSLERYGDFSRVRAERFGDTLPTSTAVQVAGLLLGATVEVDVVAFVPAS